MITTMVPRVIEELCSSSNGKRLIQIERTRQVEKLMATEKFGAIISNHLLQSPGLLHPTTEPMEKSIGKSIESRKKNSSRQREECTIEPFRRMTGNSNPGPSDWNNSSRYGYSEDLKDLEVRSRKHKSSRKSRKSKFSKNNN